MTGTSFRTTFTWPSVARTQEKAHLGGWEVRTWPSVARTQEKAHLGGWEVRTWPSVARTQEKVHLGGGKSGRGLQ